MSGIGGESEFVKSSSKRNRITSTPPEERAILIIEIPQDAFLDKIAPERGAMADSRGKLKNKEEYENSNESDMEYYRFTEIRLPKIEPKYIKGYMIKGE